MLHRSLTSRAGHRSGRGSANSFLKNRNLRRERVTRLQHARAHWMGPRGFAGFLCETLSQAGPGWRAASIVPPALRAPLRGQRKEAQHGLAAQPDAASCPYVVGAILATHLDAECEDSNGISLECRRCEQTAGFALGQVRVRYSPRRPFSARLASGQDSFPKLRSHCVIGGAGVG